MESGYNISNRKRFAKITGGSMNNSMKKNIRHFFLLTALAAGTIHLVNRFIDMTAEMKNILKTESGSYYHWKNGSIFYTKRGSGSPLLLIHELNPISSSYEWCRLVKKLEKHYTVYTIDLLGCGRSDKPYLTYTNYLYVQLLTDFIHDVIGERPDVVTTGNSISFAVLAQNMNPNLLASITAINPPAMSSFDCTPDKYSSVKKTLLELPILGTFLYNVRTHESNIQRTLQKTYFSRPQLVSSKMLDTINGYNSVSVKNTFFAPKKEIWSYVLLPVWTITYKGRDGKVYYYSMNGQNGNICGDLPVDRPRLALTSILIALGILVFGLLGGYFLW